MDRKATIHKRKHLSLIQRQQKEKAIVQKLLPFLEGNIGAYVPILGEVDIMEVSLSKGKVFLPKVLDNQNMEFILFDGNLKEGAFGVMEPSGPAVDPESLDVIVVPMVNFCGFHRRGYGKGYYDRYLKKTKALKIGVAFDLQEDEFSAGQYDVDMDILITETKLWRNPNANTILWRQ